VGTPVIWILGGIAVVLVVVIGLLALLLAGAGGGDATPTDAAFQPTATATAEPEITDEPATELPPPTASETTPGTTPSPTIVPTTSPTELPTAVPTVPPTDTPVTPTATPPPTEVPAAHFGRLVFSSNRDGNPEIYVVDLAGGEPRRLTSNNANDWLPDWSPDGGRIVFTSHRTGSYDLWVMNADGSGQAAWVTTGAWDEYARWAPDGQRLSFSTTARTQGIDNSEIFIRQAGGQLTQLTQSTAEDQWADWSPDSRLVYTEGFKDSSDWDIHIINANGSNHLLWLDQPSCDVQPTWSPDGQWIAFLRMSSDTNGNGRVDFEDTGDVWVGSASGGGLRQLTSGLWATTPAWSPDSQWIAFARVRDSNSNGRSDGNDRVDILAVPLSGGDTVPLVTSSQRDGDPSWTW
jgi:Tol biopolymer transport system component